MSDAAVVSAWNVWLFAPKDDFVDQLVGRLVKRRFTVRSLGGQLVTKQDDVPGCAIAISLVVPKSILEDATGTAAARKVYDEIVDDMKIVKGAFWGIVVTEAHNSIWFVGNISLKAEEQARLEAIKLIN